MQVKRHGGSIWCTPNMIETGPRGDPRRRACLQPWIPVMVSRVCACVQTHQICAGSMCWSLYINCTSVMLLFKENNCAPKATIEKADGKTHKMREYIV